MLPFAPVRMTVHWIWKYTYLVALECFLLIAWRSVTSGQFGAAALFAALSVLVVLAMVHARSFAEVDRNRVLIYNAPFGKYMILWDEVSYVETDGVGYIFHGSNKSLSLNTLLGNNTQEICRTIDNQIQQRKIEVKRVMLAPTLLARNTKIA